MFFGTPSPAVPSLQALLGSDIEVAAVVTNPDKPYGRRRELRASPIKEEAVRNGVQVLQPARARDPEFAEQLRALEPEVAVVVAYGKILPGDLLAIPRRGFVNLHFSLLPSYRGAAPVQRALMDGVTETGISIMVLTEGMDEGPVLAQERAAVDPEESAGDLGGRLAVLGAELLVRTVSAYALGELEPVPQDDARATYAPKITDDDARIAWDSSSGTIRNHVRALNPEPGAWTLLNGDRLKLFRVSPVDDELAPGALRNDGRAVLVGTADVPLRIDDAQLAGRKRLSGPEFARGLRLEGTESLT